MHFTSFPEKKTQLHFYLQTSIYHLQTPLKNYLTSWNPRKFLPSGYLPDDALLCQSNRPTPPFFYSFWPLGRAFLQEGEEGGGNSEKVGASTFHFHSTYLLCSLSLLTIELRKFFLPGEFPTTSKVSNLPSPPLSPPPLGNGSDSINVRRRTYPPLFHASVNPGIFPCKGDERDLLKLQVGRRGKNTYLKIPPVFIKTYEEK